MINLGFDGNILFGILLSWLHLAYSFGIMEILLYRMIRESKHSSRKYISFSAWAVFFIPFPPHETI